MSKITNHVSYDNKQQAVYQKGVDSINQFFGPSVEGEAEFHGR
jgi:hypothetical protein